MKEEKENHGWEERAEALICKCACHANSLKQPYEHETRCCIKMNGYLEKSNPIPECSDEVFENQPAREGWKERFNNKFPELFDGLNFVTRFVEDFIESEIKEAKRMIAGEWEERIKTRIEIAKICIEEHQTGNVMGSGQSPVDAYHEEQAVKIALEQLLRDSRCI